MQYATVAEFQAYDRKKGYSITATPFPSYGSPFTVSTGSPGFHRWDVSLTDIPELSSLGKADKVRVDYAQRLLYAAQLDYITMLRAESSPSLNNMDRIREWTGLPSAHKADRKVTEYINIVSQLLPVKLWYALCQYLAGIMESNEFHTRADERIAHANNRPPTAIAA